MREWQLRRLPVVNAHGELVGIVSLNDLARHLNKTEARSLTPAGIAQTLSAVCQPRTHTLTASQFKVACEAATEPPFHNAYWNNHEAGLYVDVTTGEPLFSSLDKFDSGSGWPSFTRPVQKDVVVAKSDFLRTEVRSKSGDAHLGHVFDDGPAAQGGLRYCINSASLRFVPVNDLAVEGYREYLTLFERTAPVATH